MPMLKNQTGTMMIFLALVSKYYHPHYFYKRNQKNMKKVLILSSLSLALIACSPEVKSIEYYENNIDEAKSVIKKCEVTQGSSQDQNCINADKAIYSKEMDAILSGGWQGN